MAFNAFVRAVIYHGNRMRSFLVFLGLAALFTRRHDATAQGAVSAE
jgi:hypothetical protein